MATNRSPIVGIFDNRAQAENAIEQLYNAGVNSDRIRYSGNPATETKTDTSHSFMDDLKGLFTGASTTGHRSVDIVNDLTAMGLNQDAAQYYAQEYEAGHTILAVEPLGQQDEAMNILRSNGAHDFNDRSNFDKISGYNKGTPNTYDQRASTGSTYNQSQGTPNAYGQQASVDRDTTLNTPTAPASGYDQGTANQGGNTFQQSNATQTSATQGYTTSNSYPQSSQQPQQAQTNPIDPYRPTPSGQQTQGQQTQGQQVSNPTATSTPRDTTAAPGAFDRSKDPNAVQGTYEQNTDPNAYGRTRDTDNPLKRFARKLKGEPDADADYNRNQIDAERDSDPNH